MPDPTDPQTEPWSDPDFLIRAEQRRLADEAERAEQLRGLDEQRRAAVEQFLEQQRQAERGQLREENRLSRATLVPGELSLHDLETLCLGLRRAITLSTRLLDPEADAWHARDFEAHFSMTREEALALVEKFQPRLDETRGRVRAQLGQVTDPAE